MSILTPDLLDEIRRDSVQEHLVSEQDIQRRVSHVSVQLDLFTKSQPNGSEEALWMAKIARSITDGWFTNSECPKTRDEVRALFESHATKAYEGHLEFFRRDPESFWEMYSPRPGKDREDPPEHIWDNIDQARRFLTFTTYQVWKLVDQIQKAGEAAVSDNLLEMVSGNENGYAVYLAVTAAYNNIIEKLVHNEI